MLQTKKKIDESTLIVIKDVKNNNIKSVIVPSSFQIGIPESPSGISITGKLSVSQKDYSLSSSNGWNISIDDHVTVATISVIGVPNPGYSRINLNKSAKFGQLLIIKDFSGRASSYPIRIYDGSNQKIDGSDYKEINVDYGSLQFCYKDSYQNF